MCSAVHGVEGMHCPPHIRAGARAAAYVRVSQALSGTAPQRSCFTCNKPAAGVSLGRDLTLGLT